MERRIADRGPDLEDGPRVEAAHQRREEAPGLPVHDRDPVALGELLHLAHDRRAVGSRPMDVARYGIAEDRHGGIMARAGRRWKLRQVRVRVAGVAAAHVGHLTADLQELGFLDACAGCRARAAVRVVAVGGLAAAACWWSAASGCGPESQTTSAEPSNGKLGIAGMPKNGRRSWWRPGASAGW